KRVIKKACELDPLVINGISIRFSELIESSFAKWGHLFPIVEKRFKNFDFSRTKGLWVGNPLTVLGSHLVELARHAKVSTFSIMHVSLNELLIIYSNTTKFFIFGENDLNSIKKLDLVKNGFIVSGSPKTEKLNTVIPWKMAESRYRILIAFSGPGHSVS